MLFDSLLRCDVQRDQRLLMFNTLSPGAPSDLARLSARFSFNDFPDFFAMDWRGDLSDTVGPFHQGADSVVPYDRLYA